MIVPPIILEDRDGYLSFFDSPDEAAGNIDIDDVLANEFSAYDSQGRALAVRPPTEPGFGGTIEPLETAPTHAEQLRAALVRALRLKGVSASAVADDAPLPRLLEEALRRKHGYHMP